MIYLNLLIFIITAICFYKIVKNNNYELNFKESILCNISLMLSLALYFINNDIFFTIIVTLCIYYIFLIIYYIVRSYKLKKYIPIKTIIGYILINILNYLILLSTTKLIEFDGWDSLGFIIFIPIISIAYIFLLLLINLIIYIIKSVNEKNNIFKNENYKISKSVYINLIIIIILTFILNIGIDYINKYKLNKFIDKSEQFVINYLSREYPNYTFKTIEAYKTETNCWMFGCNKEVVRVDVYNKENDINFYVDIDMNLDENKNMIIYEDSFKEELDNIKQRKIDNLEEYIKNNYNMYFKYNLKNDKLEDVHFIILKEYNKEDINIFVNDMKDAFNYIEKNFYDLDYINLDFINGNPFYEGSNSGTINENSNTHELWIMVNGSLIAIKK